MLAHVTVYHWAWLTPGRPLADVLVGEDIDWMPWYNTTRKSEYNMLVEILPNPELYVQKRNKMYCVCLPLNRVDSYV